MPDKTITRQYLIDTFKEAKARKKCVCIEVTIPGQNETEFIINKNSSIDNKLEYYLNTYNENLEHNRNNTIKIVNVFPVDWKENK